MNVHDYRQCSRLLYMRRKSPDAPAFSAQCARSLMEQPESMLARRMCSAFVNVKEIARDCFSHAAFSAHFPSSPRGVFIK